MIFAFLASFFLCAHPRDSFFSQEKKQDEQDRSFAPAGSAGWRKKYPAYTDRDSRIGFGLQRKLPRFDDRKSPNIRNMGRFAIVKPRGFGAAETPILESRSVYLAAVGDPSYPVSYMNSKVQGEGLLLYYSSSCPYSHKVIRYLEETNQTIPMKEISCDKEAKAEFKARGDSMVVPCLYIDGKPLYESDAIINWLKTHPERTSHAQQSA
jgi:glutaredoxin